MTEPGSFECRRFRITGRVQGVFFRASTRDMALGLSLTGYARNLPDGAVEVCACGPADAVDKLAVWLRDGPPMATVMEVHSELLDSQDFGGFSVA
jgi:acylphosphatase